MSTYQNEDLSGQDFSNGILDVCVFRNCDLRYCDFTNTSLQNCFFDECFFEGSVFKDTIMHGVYFSGCAQAAEILANPEVTCTDCHTQAYVFAYINNLFNNGCIQSAGRIVRPSLP